MLIYLAVDLSRDPALLRRFEESPREVYEMYGIGEETLRILRAGGRKEVESVLSSETGRILDRLSVLEPVMLWGGIALQIKSCSPSSAHILTEVEFAVKAAGLAPDATLSFAGPSSVNAVTVQVNNPGTADGTLIGVASFRKAGSYTVILKNPSRPNPEKSNLVGGFTAQQ